MITISLAEDWLTPCQITLGLNSNTALTGQIMTFLYFYTLFPVSTVPMTPWIPQVHCILQCTGALHMLTPAQTVCVVCAPHLRR